MSTNLTTEQVNKEYISNQPYRRIGACKDCNGRCCNFVALPLDDGNGDYFGLHGIRMEDQWDGANYVVIPAYCQQCVSGGKCALFGKDDMPVACRQFPISPHDTVWRYLRQIGTPCGFEFVDRETGEPWDMRRKRPESVAKDGTEAECVLSSD